MLAGEFLKGNFLALNGGAAIGVPSKDSLVLSEDSLKKILWICEKQFSI